MTDMSSDWLAAPVLSGSTLTLAPPGLADAADYLSALGDDSTAAEVVRHLPFSTPRAEADVRRIIQEALDTPDRVAYAQRLSETGGFAGTTSFYEVNPGQRSLAIGHTWIARRFWRTGVNTESKLLMLSRAFDQLGAERVVWHTDVLNDRSQAAIERLGAAKEGVLRHHRIRPDGSWRDTVQYSLLSAEWPEVRRRLSDSLSRRAP